MNDFQTLTWVGDCRGHLRLLDQTLLPAQLVYRECRTVEEVWEAIKVLRVRGAPAIGIAAAYGVVVGMQTWLGDPKPDDRMRRLHQVVDYLRSSRPTAVNLFWALERVQKAGEADPSRPAETWLESLLRVAKQIHDEDRAMCRAIGRHGAELIQPGTGVLTHCNAGGLATAEYGTALAVIYAAREQGKTFCVYVDETRPLWQGARLTA
jgi:methylthioribose-1-phosphate isomerase